ncbi:hypothetical protein CVM73_22100 [Bradyrhizobium forestalis]|uniref:Acyl-CoA dehydrogenase C-terminal domain-containing protein n=2 Tax=Bradyrhizobium TaxID=374 RepID=A0A2M8R5I0_9BRAD|nr:hypothetical protein [Bradyrhizobium cajani]PJG53075.1 hypothetical protein CVM73_22100 [Bradyrhizobium forestalis]
MSSLAATTELFEVGGAFSDLRELAIDRHWRNARTIASHNPVNSSSARSADMN